MTNRQRLRKRAALIRRMCHLKDCAYFVRTNKERKRTRITNKQNRQAIRYHWRLMKLYPEAFDLVLGTNLCNTKP